MYYRSLSEILLNLICIINIVRFEFQIQTLFFYSNQAFWHLCGTQFSCIQVCLTKFTFVKIKPRENFGEFIRFSPEGLSPFKIHRRFKFEYVPGFLTWILLGI
jgi:hypothetical protein